MSVEERLAEIADRIVEFRTRDAKLDAARRLVETTGSASADEIATALADWAPPSGQELADLVARKAEAAVEFEERQAEAARLAVANAEAKIEDFETLAALARADVEAARTSDPIATSDAKVEEAHELLAAAVAAGGVPSRAPSGRSIAATPMASGTREG